MPGKAIDRDDRRGTIKPPAIEPIHPSQNVNKYALRAFLFTNPQIALSSNKSKTLHL
jgi:hypothetical protein